MPRASFLPPLLLRQPNPAPPAVALSLVDNSLGSFSMSSKTPQPAALFGNRTIVVLLAIGIRGHDSQTACPVYPASMYHPDRRLVVDAHSSIATASGTCARPWSTTSECSQEQNKRRGSPSGESNQRGGYVFLYLLFAERSFFPVS